MRFGPGWDTKSGRIAGGIAIVLLLLLLGICALPAPPPTVEVQRYGAHLNVEVTVPEGPFLPAIGTVVREQRAKLGAGAGLETAGFVFRQSPDRPFATLDYPAAALLAIGPDSSDADVIDAAGHVSERQPTGPMLLRTECALAADALRITELCQRMAKGIGE